MKISIKYYVLSIMVILFLCIIHTTNYILPVYAIDSTPSADIRSKLEELKKEIASKAAKLKGEIDRKLKDKAFVGKVITKSPATLTLTTKNGPKIININQDSKFESTIKGKKFSQKSVAEEDYLATLGDVDEIGVLTAKKIILLPPADPQLKTYLWGQIVAISDKLATLKGRDLKNVAVSLPADNNVKLNNFVILTGSRNKNDIFVTEFVYIIPQGGILRIKKIATPSAKETTKSAN